MSSWITGHSSLRPIHCTVERCFVTICAQDHGPERYDVKPVIDLQPLGWVMHEFHAWICLSQSTAEDDDELLEEAVSEVKDLVSRSTWHDAAFELRKRRPVWSIAAGTKVVV
jgi:hypothetical protein